MADNEGAAKPASRGANRPTAHDVTVRDGARIRLWERTTADDPDEAVLFVHGATYGGIPMFDPPVGEGYGWLSFAAERGQAAFAIDLRGYGQSDPPAAYDEPPADNGPALSHGLVARDVADVVDFLREERGFDRLHYVGYSAGTWRARALYNNFDPEFATVTLAGGSFRDLDVGADPDGPAYERSTREDFFDRWLGEVPDGEDVDRWIGGDEFTAEEVLSATWEAIVDSNQAMADEPDTVRKPLRQLDVENHPGEITDPTLVIRGTSDPSITREGSLRLYDALGAERNRKQYTEIAGGTHFFLLEERRHQLYDITHRFQSQY